MRNRGHNHHDRKHYHNNYQRQQQRDRLALNPSGAIFMCNNNTKKECFSRRIFGLPATREFFVRQVKEGMYLFLFDADDRQMCGVFKAASNGSMNIVPEAFSSSGSTYPAQVQFTIECMYEPLTEKEFKPAIQEKYFDDMKFNFDLNSDQVHRLLILFGAKKVSWVHQPINCRWDPSSSMDSSFNCFYSNRQVETLGQANSQIQISYDKPNNEGSNLLMVPNTNLPTLGNINQPQQIDPNEIETRILKTYHSNNVGSYQCQFPSELTQQGIISPSSLRLDQQQQHYENPTGTFTSNLYNSRMVSSLGYESRLEPQNQSLLYVSSGNQQFSLPCYNPLNLTSSQSVQFYPSNHSSPRNLVTGVSTSSNFSRPHLQGQFYNVVPQNDYCANISQDVGPIGAPKISPSVGDPCSYQIESGNQLPENAISDLAPNLDRDPKLSFNPNPIPNATLYSDVEQKKSVFSRLAHNPQMSPQEKHYFQPGGCLSINQIPPGHLVQQLRDQNGLNITDKPICSEWVVQDQDLACVHGLAGPGIEVNSDSAVTVEGIDVDPTAEVLNSIVVPDELLVNFKRRNGGNKLDTQLGGDKKKRRLIRPSLELEDKDNDLHSLKGHMHEVAMSSNKQSEQAFLVSIDSVYSRENMVITDTMDVEGQVDSRNSESMLGQVCKTTTISCTEVIPGHQDHRDGEMVLLSSCRMEMMKENQDIEKGIFCINSQPNGSDSYFKAESLESSTGESRYKSNEMFVVMEIESQQQNNDLENSHGCLGYTALERFSEKLTADLENVNESKSNGSQIILISGSEKLDASELELKSLSSHSANSSEGQMESLVLGERTEQKKPVSTAEHVISKPKIKFEDRYVLGIGIEPNNRTFSVFLHEEAVNLLDGYIPLEPEAGNLETGLLSLAENSYPVEDYIALD